MTEEPSKDFLRGYRIGHEEAKKEFEERGISIGVKLEQERIQSLINMQIQWALESNDRTEATTLNRIKDEISSFFIEDFEDEEDIVDFK